ncbi:WD40 repeat-like protein [Saccharata proteae CBS 121410]|uniref:Mitochondrial division protein 1 n=1 Tax=Saccharata proteae CBS 121410 TaxID=1314787 RepID=A0A9P4I035_9PEZI|nr:WD40 repeat-like protein [Saccharata proteae CBS 121410]KAF2088385.1 WD40 repeat-like protein [Saccharata proteae CBS 121410]
MDDMEGRSPKRRRSDDGGYIASADTHAPVANPSPSYQITERPAPQRYEAGDNTRSPYHSRSGPHDGSRSPSSSSSPSHEQRRRSRSESQALPRRSPSPDVFEKPTELHYKAKLKLCGHRKGISAVRFSPDGRLIASCSADATVKIWDAKTGKLQHTLEGHMAGISCIAWAADSRMLASGSDDKNIRLWDAITGKDLSVAFEGHHNYVYSVAFSPKGNMLISGSYDEAIFLWDVRSARVMRSLPAHSDPVGGIDFVRDGTMVVSCSSDGLIRVWDTATGQCLRTLVHEDNAPVTSVRFSPNGRYVLAWTLDSSIRLWDYINGKGKCVKTYQGHQNCKYSLSGAFGVFGTAPYQYPFIASGSEDGSVILWDVSSKNIMQRLVGHEGAVLGVDTHPTEPWIVSAGMDKTIRLWKMEDKSQAQDGHNRPDETEQ